MGFIFNPDTPTPTKPPPVPDYAAIAAAAEEEQRMKARKRSGREKTILTDLGDQSQSTLLGD